MTVAWDLRLGEHVCQYSIMTSGGREGLVVEKYETPTIEVLGTVAEFTRGDRFAWQFDGMSLAEVIQNVLDGGHALGTS